MWWKFSQHKSASLHTMYTMQNAWTDTPQHEKQDKE